MRLCTHTAYVTSSADAETSKPAPETVQTALERSGVDPANASMVDDTRWAILAAARAEIACVTLLIGGIGRDELRGAGAAGAWEELDDCWTTWMPPRSAGFLAGWHPVMRAPARPEGDPFCSGGAAEARVVAFWVLETGVDGLLLSSLGKNVIVEGCLLFAVPSGVPPARGDLRRGVLRPAAVVAHQLTPLFNVPGDIARMVVGAVRADNAARRVPWSWSAKHPADGRRATGASLKGESSPPSWSHPQPRRPQCPKAPRCHREDRPACRPSSRFCLLSPPTQ